MFYSVSQFFLSKRMIEQCIHNIELAIIQLLDALTCDPMRLFGDSAAFLSLVTVMIMDRYIRILRLSDFNTIYTRRLSQHRLPSAGSGTGTPIY